MKKNLILCGFMGSGKSTIGKLLSEKLGARFIDTDAYIVKQQGMTIPEIFAKYGEAHFRELEHQACEELSKLNKTVISTGGGTLLNDDNRRVLKQNGVVFLLNVSSRTVLTRLKNDTTRPLLQQEDKERAVKMMLSARTPLYNIAADYVIDAEESPRKVCLKILSIYNSL